MKTLNKFSFITLFVLMIIGNTIQPAKAQNGYYSASYQDFYNDLAPYGQWINDQQYGYIWLPDVGSDFRPYYTNGYWAMTDYGNTWVSGYDWGWAAFHYGRWTFDNYYGWLWIPGTEWAPAWVSWRSNNSYYGWAPMGPGINININIGNIPMDWWVFLSPNYFYQRSFQNNCFHDLRYTRNIYQQTNYINYVYNSGRVRCYTGPRANDYYRQTGQRASMYSISNNNRRGATVASGNRLNIYRPNIQRNNNERPKQVAQTGRQLSPRLQNYGNGVTNNGARQELLNQRVGVNSIDNNRNKLTRENDNQQREQRNNDVQQQRALQLREQQAQQQRDQQIIQQREQRNNDVQQQRAQQLREQQAQQQRDQQIIQQREQRNNDVQQQRAQQLREQQAQQQREQQIIQQREQRNNELQQRRAQQLREQQAQQQRDQQIIQQREQRNNELQQQRAQQLRDQQKTQERNNEKQERMRSIERGGQNQERQNTNNEARPFGGRR